MEIEERGCVYFFRHIGLSPIKIGYSESESPIKRFEQFKTYAPFGAELIGFIRTKTAKKLETELHQKYSRDRIKGEWFEISKDEAEKTISFYSNLEDIEEVNNFQVFFAKHIAKINNIEFSDNDTKIAYEFFKNFSLIETEKTNFVYLSQTEISELLKIDKTIVSKFMRTQNLESKVYKIDGKAKRAYKLNKYNFE